MAETIDELEARLADLRVDLREATRARDKASVSRIRREMRGVEAAWEEALDREEASAASDSTVLSRSTPSPSGDTETVARPPMGIPVREQVHQALTVLGAPAAPKLISAAYQAFFIEPLIATKLASLRRDEERSFSSQGHTRPYYICAALTHDRFSVARGLLAVSTWPLDRRIIGPFSPRVDFLTHAVGTASQIERLASLGHQPSEGAWRLLRRFALNIPGAHEYGEPNPTRVIAAAQAEITVHQETDTLERTAAAVRARGQLTDVQVLFGAPLQQVERHRTVSGT
ncbi:hypothetical protein GCM10009665_01110 [Kitasatospora nipponensis]|uniref:Uncharacterized protein n=1 Tax=Kitasatospora nipponensis TaxID=258049 RepID=A0ABN1VMF2_9ACTN